VPQNTCLRNVHHGADPHRRGAKDQDLGEVSRPAELRRHLPLKGAASHPRIHAARMEWERMKEDAAGAGTGFGRVPRWP